MWIYKITNKVNGKVYIGQTRNKPEDRWRKHYTDSRSNSRIHKALHKYSKNNFIFETIDQAASILELNQKECFYITLFNSLSPFGYNLDTGGGSRFVSEETRNKLSHSLSGKTPWNKGLRYKIKPSEPDGNRKKTWNKGLKGKQAAWNKSNKPIVAESIKGTVKIMFSCLSDVIKNNFSKPIVCMCLKNKRKQHKGFTWRYA